MCLITRSYLAVQTLSCVDMTYATDCCTPTSSAVRLFSVTNSSRRTGVLELVTVGTEFTQLVSYALPATAWLCCCRSCCPWDRQTGGHGPRHWFNMLTTYAACITNCHDNGGNQTTPPASQHDAPLGVTLSTLTTSPVLRCRLVITNGHSNGSE